MAELYEQDQFNWNETYKELFPQLLEALRAVGCNGVVNAFGLFQIYFHGELVDAGFYVQRSTQMAEMAIELGHMTLADFEDNPHLRAIVGTFSALHQNCDGGSYTKNDIIEAYFESCERVYLLETARPGYIYLIQAVSPVTYYKIGLTKSPTDRITTLGVQLPFPIKVLHLIKTNHMRKAEKHLHERYAEKRVNGEWFELSQEDVDFVCNLRTVIFHDVKFEFPKD